VHVAMIGHGNLVHGLKTTRRRNRFLKPSARGGLIEKTDPISITRHDGFAASPLSYP
jgi:hypothetical protein